MSMLGEFGDIISRAVRRPLINFCELVKTALQGVLQFAIPGVTVYSRSSLQAPKSVRRRLALSATRKFSSDKSR